MLNPDHLDSARYLINAGDFDKAADCYFRIVAKCQRELAKDPNNVRVMTDRTVAIDALADLAAQLLAKGKYGQASDYVERLLKQNCDSLTLQLVYAQVLMLRGSVQEARQIFLKHRGQTIQQKSWDARVLSGFDALRQIGRDHPLMQDIEAELARPIPTSPPALSTPNKVEDVHQRAKAELERFEQTLADHIQFLRRYTEQSRSDRPPKSGDVDHREVAIEGISDAVIRLIARGEIDKALNAIEVALEAKQNGTRSLISKAHVMMCRGQVGEARDLYVACSQQPVDAKRNGRSVILDDITALREAKVVHPLMIEVERLLSKL